MAADMQPFSAHDFDLEDDMFVDAFPYVGKRCYISVKNGEVLECLNDFHTREEDLRAVYRSAVTTAIDADVDKIYADAVSGETRAWRNFCNDIVIVAVLRQMLYDFKIRIVFPRTIGELV